MVEQQASKQSEIFSSNHHLTLLPYLSIIFFRKPVSTFRNHALEVHAAHSAHASAGTDRSFRTRKVRARSRLLRSLNYWAVA
jgi:hypothetical protein